MLLFSIIIPVYNVAPYLRECLDSVLAQTFTDWEAICVDDGSTDGSGTILDEYAVKDKRFRVIHQQNVGVSTARNVALTRAQGEWFCFLDADDKVECHWLQDIADGANKYPKVDWIRTSYRDWIDGKESVPWSKDSVHRYTEKTYELTGDVIWGLLSFAAMPFLNIYRRGAHEITFISGLAYCEDSCFAVDYFCIAHPKVLLTIPNDDYRYRIRKSSASHSMRCGDVTTSLEVLMSRWRMCPGRFGRFTPAILRYIFRCIYWGQTMTTQEARGFQFFLWKAVWCGFFSPFHVNGKRQSIRWILFMVFGKPQFLTDKAGIRWFFGKLSKND